MCQEYRIGFYGIGYDTNPTIVVMIIFNIANIPDIAKMICPMLPMSNTINHQLMTAVPILKF